MLSWNCLSFKVGCGKGWKRQCWILNRWNSLLLPFDTVNGISHGSLKANLSASGSFFIKSLTKLYILYEIFSLSIEGRNAVSKAVYRTALGLTFLHFLLDLKRVFLLTENWTFKAILRWSTLYDVRSFLLVKKKIH